MDRWSADIGIFEIAEARSTGRSLWERDKSDERGNYDSVYFERATSTYSPFVEHATAGETSKGAGAREQSCQRARHAATTALADRVLYNSRVAVVWIGRRNVFCHPANSQNKKPRTHNATCFPNKLTDRTASVVVVTHSPKRISLMSFVKGLLMRADVLSSLKNVSCPR